MHAFYSICDKRRSIEGKKRNIKEKTVSNNVYVYFFFIKENFQQNKNLQFSLIL